MLLINLFYLIVKEATQALPTLGILEITETFCKSIKKNTNITFFTNNNNMI